MGFTRRNGLLSLCALYVYSLFITFFLLPAKKVNTKIKQAITEKPAEQENSIVEENHLHELNGESNKHSVEIVQSKNKDLKEILTSSYYLLHLYWFAVVHLRATFYAAGFNSWVEHLTQSDREGKSVDFVFIIFFNDEIEVLSRQ